MAVFSISTPQLSCSSSSLSTFLPPSLSTNSLFSLTSSSSPKPSLLFPIKDAEFLGLGFSSSATTVTRRNAHKYSNKCSARFSSFQTEFGEQSVVYPRPEEIPWQKELANTVSLIGIVGASLQIKNLSSGKAFAWTRLAVKKSATETLWIGLTFWNELAYTAFQHVEKGKRIYVTGRLSSDVVIGEEDKSQTYYKVVVNQFNFIEKSLQTSTYEPEMNSAVFDERPRNNSVNITDSVEELWQAFFANPLDWWDNRKNKRNPKYPDFKHKDTGEALWAEGRNNPHWVKQQLAILDSKLQLLQDSESNLPASFYVGR